MFQLYPFLASFFYSFTDLSIANDWSWVGLSNYIKSFTADRDFWNSLKVTGIYVFIAVPCKLVFALFIAMVLNMKIRGIRFFQTLYYIPCCFSERMRKLFRKNEKNVLRFCNKKAKEKRRLQRVKKPM